jgi:hypothetical protein
MTVRIKEPVMPAPRLVITAITAAALVAVLSTGLAAPAIAAPRPVVFPTCSTMLPARDFAAGGLMSGWTRYTTPPFTTPLYGASDTRVVAMITSRPSVTCTWTRVKRTATISETTLNAADLKSLRAYFRSIGVTGASHGGPALSYAFAPAGHPTWIERHTVFPDGTVVFTLDRSGTVNGAMSQDANDVLIGLNPWINV